MKPHPIESALFGLFFGVMVAAYVVVAVGLNGTLGKALSFITITPFIEFLMRTLHLGYSLWIPFLWIVLLFTFYGYILGVIVNKISKARSVLVVAVLICCSLLAIGNELISQGKYVSPQRAFSLAGLSESVVASVLNFQNSKKVYQPTSFLTEYQAEGDINNDGSSDLVFLLPRDEGSKVTLYYIGAIMRYDDGRTKTLPLVYLGGEVRPQRLAIKEGLIEVTYVNRTAKTPATEQMFFDFEQGQLIKKGVSSRDASNE